MLRKSRNYFALLIPLALLGFCFQACYRGKEPTYAGMRLSRWVELYVSPAGMEFHAPNPAAEAIARIGTNAIPHLLQWIPFEPPAWRKHAFDAANTALRFARVPCLLTDHQEFRAAGATEAFAVLGASARNAAGGLGALANQVKTSRLTKERAVAALGYIGKDALPALANVLTNNLPDSPRASAIKQIAAMGTNALPILPLLLEWLGDEDEAVAVGAFDILSTLPLDLNRGLVIAAWSQCLQDAKLNIRLRAVHRFKSFGITTSPTDDIGLRLLDDDDGYVRFNALHTPQRTELEPLRNITGQ